MRPHALLLCSLLVGCDAPIDPDAGGGDAGADAGTPLSVRSWIRDDGGGVLILRGTNIENASKWAPDFLPTNYVTADDFRPLVDELGMNAVRMLIFWEAVEPERGVYDDVYLAEVRRRVEAAGAAGLHVIVDMHQDVFGRGFGNDGAPRWACDEALYASFTPPAEWFLGYFEPEVEECFDRLWNDPDLRGAYAAAWGHVAEVLAGADGLLVYELMNEPSWGTAPVRQFEREIAPAAYAEWIDAIRAHDPDAYVMMDPASAANVGLSSNLDPPERERLVYAPHVYPPSLERGLGWTGTPEDVLELTATVVDDSLRMGLPAVVGETGARDDVDGALVFLDQVYDAFDADRLGATQWEGGRASGGSYAVFDETGAPSVIGRAIARPHPARTAGEPLSWSFDGSVFTFAWREDGSATGDTLVTFPSVAFPAGADIAVEDGGEALVEGAIVVIPPIGGQRLLTIRAR